MFTQVGVKNSVQVGYTPWQTPLWADTPPRQTPPWAYIPRHTPSRQTPPGRHPPPRADTPPLRRPLQQTVCILLECIPVINISSTRHILQKLSFCDFSNFTDKSDFIETYVIATTDDSISMRSIAMQYMSASIQKTSFGMKVWEMEQSFVSLEISCLKIQIRRLSHQATPVWRHNWQKWI